MEAWVRRPQAENEKAAKEVEKEGIVEEKFLQEMMATAEPDGDSPRTHEHRGSRSHCRS